MSELLNSIDIRAAWILFLCILLTVSAIASGLVAIALTMPPTGTQSRIRRALTFRLGFLCVLVCAGAFALLVAGLP